MLRPAPKGPNRSCSAPEVDTLQTLAEALQKTAYRKIHTYPFSSVPLCWRRLYTDAGIILAILLIWKFQKLPLEKCWDETETAFIEKLDMVLIMTGAPGPSREEAIHQLLSSISSYTPTNSSDASSLSNFDTPRPTKRQRTSPAPQLQPIPDVDLRTLPSSPIPPIKFPIPRYKNPPSLPAFRAHISQPCPTPFIISSLTTSYPCSTTNPWHSTSYLLSVTNTGKRLVPVEVGEAYTSSDWGQEIIPFRDFLSKYILHPDGNKRGYLAQHHLLRQIPALRNDLVVPDYCYISPTTSKEQEGDEDEAEPAAPILNTWFGPPSTISPLHTDPHHNLLLQLFGKKYIRLYPPSATPYLFPRGKDENGVDMSNTSSIPWEMVEGGMDGENIGGVSGLGGGVDVEDAVRFGGFEGVEYVECVLDEGEGLFLPRGWWHYVRGLSVGWSVSCWWD
ncbi:Clavaminate synthase-like protein [Ascobolus immersus RN42]|uniref:Clavaminate synthase-like protein n=1 Tax=Ascobolus immersus RN42 TaxID=1160509 RepID=A0A3N4HD99_ASCIM|nr:Clavaminate synthase-like protein [Ascobolus immersus RN42]